jgi:hypothetical protein
VPSSAWEVASATADDAAKGTPSGKVEAGHHETREVRKDMVGRDGDHSGHPFPRRFERNRLGS